MEQSIALKLDHMMSPAATAVKISFNQKCKHHSYIKFFNPNLEAHNKSRASR